MKPFKYRVWNKSAQTMNEVLTLTSAGDPDTIWISGVMKIPYDPDNLILMAYPGVKDMHGNDICEGDIIRKEECSPDDMAFGYYGDIGIIKYDVDVMGFIIESEDDGFYDNTGRIFSFNDIEVIGNIYENPDIMKVTEDKEHGGNQE